MSRVKQHLHECPGTYDFVVLYLDDGIVAGTDEAVAWFWSNLQTELTGVGLQANFSKCTATPSSGGALLADASGCPRTLRAT